MAKDAKPSLTEGEPPKKSKKLLIIILAGVLLLLVAGGGAAFLLLSGGDEEAAEEEEVVQEEKKPRRKKASADTPPVFVNLDPYTVNLIPEEGQGDQYMQVVIALELEDMAADPIIKGQMPRIRNNITMILSSKKASELLSKEGKEQLAEEIREEVNQIIEPPPKGKKAEWPVLSVLFTSFIIQ